MKRHTATALAASAALALAACTSGDANHPGSNVKTDDPPADIADPVDDRDPTERDDTDDGPPPEDDDEIDPGDDIADNGGWQVLTHPYGEPAPVELDDTVQGVWTVTADAPVCGATLELPDDGFTHSDDPNPQGQFCTVDVTGTNDADQPLTFWSDLEFAVADWDGRTFTPDADATMDAYEGGMIYDERQPTQTFDMTVWFDLPADLTEADLAGVAAESRWAFLDDGITVWTDGDNR